MFENFGKYSEKIPVSLIPEKNNGCFISRPVYMCVNISNSS